jgi:hypothetical protein
VDGLILKANHKKLFSTKTDGKALGIGRFKKQENRLNTCNSDHHKFIQVRCAETSKREVVKYRMNFEVEHEIRWVHVTFHLKSHDIVFSDTEKGNNHLDCIFHIQMRQATEVEFIHKHTIQV